MPAELPDEVVDWVEQLLDGTLDDAGHRKLAERAAADPSLVREISNQLGMAAALRQLGEPGAEFVGHTAAHVRKIAGEGEFEFATGVKRRIIRRRWTRALAMAAVLSLAALPLAFRLRDSSPAAVATLLRMTPDNRVVSSTPIRAGTKLDEKAGLFRLDFANGALMAIQAPAKLTVVSGMEIRLVSGRLNGWCPDSAHGFKVRTSSAALTDLGTSFGIHTDAAGRSEFMVLTGRVEVEKGREKIRLTEGNALGTSKDNPLESMAFDPSGYRTTWPLANGIFSTKGAVIPADPNIPEKLVKLEDNDHVLVIPERRELLFYRPIQAEILGPGKLPGDIDGTVHTIEPIPGKRLSSFVIRFNPVGEISEEHFLHFRGEVTFDRPVFAIACQLGPLADGDSFFSTATWEDPLRGIELQQELNPPDSVTLSDDRRTVTVEFYAGRSTDDIRVILEDN